MGITHKTSAPIPDTLVNLGTQRDPNYMLIMLLD
jgi:hypothetical protein